MNSAAENEAGPSFELDEEERLLRDEVRRFAEERIRPGVEERDREARFPTAVVREMGEMGLLGMLVGEEYGGVGFSPMSYVTVVEELARVCPAVAVIMSVSNSVCCWPISRFGSEELKREVLPPLASGEEIGGLGLTESSSGSDAGSLRATARRQGDEWVLNGEKAWITNAGHARYFVVMAKTDPEAGKKGISAFVVPNDAPGLTVGEPERKMGLRASQTAPLLFENCRIPARFLLGGEGEGFRIALKTLDHSRLGIAAQSVCERQQLSFQMASTPTNSILSLSARGASFERNSALGGTKNLSGWSRASTRKKTISTSFGQPRCSQIAGTMCDLRASVEKAGFRHMN